MQNQSHRQGGDDYHDGGATVTLTSEAPVRVRRCPVCHEPLLLIQRDPPSTAAQTGAWVPYCRLCQMEIVR